jgi:hypothetical protein
MVTPRKRTRRCRWQTGGRHGQQFGVSKLLYRKKASLLAIKMHNDKSARVGLKIAQEDVIDEVWLVKRHIGRETNH